MQFTPHFPRGEMQCKHCGRIGPYEANWKSLLEKLEKLRALAGGTPIHVTNAYRCPTKNMMTAGSDPNSPHMYAQAADIWHDTLSVDELARLAEQAGFTGIGRYFHDQFVHVDIAPYARWYQPAEGGRVIYE